MREFKNQNERICGGNDMALLIESEPIPLETDADGVVRVGGTRITLDTIVAAFSQGATAEEITHQYPALNLADVYAVIAYYLRQREAVESYLQHQQKESDNIRKQNESRFDPNGVRDRLLARRTKRETDVAASC